MELNTQLLKRFIKVQKKLETYNAYGTYEKQKTIETDLENLIYARKQAERDYRVLHDQLRKQKQDVDNITSKAFSAYFLTEEDHNRVVEKEKQEYEKSSESVKKAEETLNITTKKYQGTVASFKEFNEKNKRAIELFNEQMMILNSQFDGEDGSDLENQLERQVGELDQEMIKLKTAINRWNNARFLLIYACNQIQNSETKWNEVIGIDLEDPQKVLPATECINNLISCHENLEKTKHLLKNVKLPFCTAEDMNLIIQLTDSIYEDMKSPEQQESTRESIAALKKSCLSLKLWFDNVIKETLMKPYSQAVHDHSRLTTELRNERIKLLTEKIREEFGKDVDLGTLEHLGETSDTLVDKMITEEETNNKKFDNSALSGVESFELPPPPSREQILGDVEEIKKTYQKTTENWNKHMEDSRNEADLKLQRMLSQFGVKQTIPENNED